MNIGVKEKVGLIDFVYLNLLRRPKQNHGSRDWKNSIFFLEILEPGSPRSLYSGVDSGEGSFPGISIR